jgi:hypothetical protein
LQASGGRPVAFPLVSYSSSSENGSSPARQAEFVRRFRDFLARSDDRSLLFARYVTLRDEGRDEGDGRATTAGKDVSAAERRRRAFLANRGLQELDGKPKPAWREWVRETRTVKR